MVVGEAKGRQKKMRKIRIIGLSLLALFALGAFMASSAFAETEILVSGGAAGGHKFETEGLLELIKLTETGSRNVLETVDCSGIFDGEFEAGSLTLGWIEDLLNLAGTVTVGEELTGEPLNCEVVSEAGALTDCTAATLANLWVDGLNLTAGDLWHVELQLMAAGAEEWLLVILKETNLVGQFSGYELECTSLLGVNGSELCNEAEPTFIAKNAATTPASVLGEIKFTAATTAAELATCTGTGKETGALSGSGNTWGLTNGARVETTLNK
jgi:hypothetical protein